MQYQTKNKRCLGIDPGIANTGYALVVKSAKRGYRLISEGLVTTDSYIAMGSRLLTIYKELSEAVATESPDVIAVERVYHNKNISSSLKTGAVIGLVHLIGAQASIEVREFTPQEVKAASGLGGSADKKQVQKMMCKMFQRERLNHHTADAVACAISGVLSSGKNKN